MSHKEQIWKIQIYSVNLNTGMVEQYWTLHTDVEGKYICFTFLAKYITIRKIGFYLCTKWIIATKQCYAMRYNKEISSQSQFYSKANICIWKSGNNVLDLSTQLYNVRYNVIVSGNISFLYCRHWLQLFFPPHFFQSTCALHCMQIIFIPFHSFPNKCQTLLF